MRHWLNGFWVHIFSLNNTREQRHVAHVLSSYTADLVSMANPDSWYSYKSRPLLKLEIVKLRIQVETRLTHRVKVTRVTRVTRVKQVKRETFELGTSDPPYPPSPPGRDSARSFHVHTAKGVKRIGKRMIELMAYRRLLKIWSAKLRRCCNFHDVNLATPPSLAMKFEVPIALSTSNL